MTVRDIPAAQTIGRLPESSISIEFSRTLIAVGQMVGDGLILTTLSYVSFRLLHISTPRTDIYRIFTILCLNRRGNSNHDFVVLRAPEFMMFLMSSSALGY